MTVAIILQCDPSFRNKASYVFETFFETLGIPFRFFESPQHVDKKDLVLCYGDASVFSSRNRTLIIPSSPQGSSYFRTRTPYDPRRVTWITWGGAKLPILFSEATTQQNVLTTLPSGAIQINHDVVASAFYFLACWQELILKARDQWDRFPFQGSLQQKLDIVQRPVVMEYLQVLHEALNTLCERDQKQPISIPLWPDGKKFAVCLTHDVHTLKRWSMASVRAEVRRCAGLVLKHKQPGRGLSRFAHSTLSVIKRENPVAPHLWLEQEKRYGYSSSFYFMTGGSSSFDPPHYWNDKASFKHAIDAIEQRGGEVGFHPSFNTYNQLDQMASEKALLDQMLSGSVFGCRQHDLRFEHPTTWRHQEAAGLIYNSTLYFAEKIGFRAGWSMPFRPYDPDRDARMRIWELPLTVMDVTLRNYERLDPEQGFESICAIIDAVRRVNGLFVMLWHPEFGVMTPAWAPIYERILEKVSSSEAYVGSGKQILDWWCARLKQLEERSS